MITVPRTVLQYVLQTWQDNLYSLSDSDFAGSRRTVKSTTSDVILLDKHYIRSWSSTQKTVTLSNEETELTALVKCRCEAIGILQVAEDWWMMLEVGVLEDLAAALGVVGRQGAETLIHVRVGSRLESFDIVRLRGPRG